MLARIVMIEGNPLIIGANLITGLLTSHMGKCTVNIGGGGLSQRDPLAHGYEVVMFEIGVRFICW